MRGCIDEWVDGGVDTDRQTLRYLLNCNDIADTSWLHLPLTWIFTEHQLYIWNFDLSFPISPHPSVLSDTPTSPCHQILLLLSRAFRILEWPPAFFYILLTIIPDYLTALPIFFSKVAAIKYESVLWGRNPAFVSISKAKSLPGSAYLKTIMTSSSSSPLTPVALCFCLQWPPLFF